jgi:hypothetical protein
MVVGPPESGTAILLAIPAPRIGTGTSMTKGATAYQPVSTFLHIGMRSERLNYLAQWPRLGG